MRAWTSGSIVALALALGAPAAAEVTASSDGGFVSHNEVLVAVPPERAWEVLLKPGEWWNGDHTYSGDAKNLSIGASPGGCFCERVPATGGKPDGQIEHMRVIYLAPHSTLRLSGGLGPLQSEAVTGTLTITLAPVEGQTRISWDYVVGGYMRQQMVQMAPLVDGVVGEQLLRLATRLGTVMDPAPRRAP